MKRSLLSLRWRRDLSTEGAAWASHERLFFGRSSLGHVCVAPGGWGGYVLCAGMARRVYRGGNKREAKRAVSNAAVVSMAHVVQAFLDDGTRVKRAKGKR